MILSIYDLSVILDSLKLIRNQEMFQNSKKNMAMLNFLTDQLKQLHDQMIDERLTEWELMTDEERGQRIIRPKYDKALTDVVAYPALTA